MVSATNMASLLGAGYESSDDDTLAEQRNGSSSIISAAPEVSLEVWFPNAYQLSHRAT